VYARNAAERGAEIEKAAKDAANDFVCAKRSILPFAVGKTDGNIVTAAQLLVVVYQAHIDINRRSLEVLKKMDTLPPAELSDQLSPLQVERGQCWADLVLPTTRALLSLVDLKRVENYRLPYLIVTKAERKGLIEWAVDNFPEFGNGTPKDKWSDPAKTANVYWWLLADKKCADEK
jgi:hypothetical protein